LVSAFYVPFSPWFHGHLLLFYVCWTSQFHAWVFLLLPVLGASHSVEWLLHHIGLHQLRGADIHAACCVEIMNLRVTVVIWSHWGCMVALHHHRSCLLLLKVTEHVGDCHCCSDHSVSTQSLRLVSLFSFFLFVDMLWVLKSLCLHLLILFRFTEMASMEQFSIIY
jgi:hypothetical protein